MTQTFKISGVDDILTRLHQCIHSLPAPETREDLLWNFANFVIPKLELEDAVIYLLDDNRKVLVQSAAYGPKNPMDRFIVDPIEIPCGMGVTGFAASTGESVLVPYTLESPLYIKDDSVRFSELAVPIKYDSIVLGVIDCEHSERDYFTEEHKFMLEVVANYLARELVNFNE